MDKLQIFKDHWDTFVARDVDHVLELFREWTGVDYQYDREEWKQVSDDTVISICYEDIADIQRPEGCTVELDTVSAPAAAWAKLCGPGLLCSTEWRVKS